MQENKDEFHKSNAEIDKWDTIMASTLIISLIVGCVVAVIAVAGMSN